MQVLIRRKRIEVLLRITRWLGAQPALAHPGRHGAELKTPEFIDARFLRNVAARACAGGAFALRRTDSRHQRELR